MKKTVLLALTSALALGAVALAGGGSGAATGGTTQAACRPIADLVASDPQFSTLGTALNAAGLTETFRGAGPFTVFAPTNAAFAKVPQDQLQALLNDREALARVLRYHVVQGRVTSAQVARLSGANTLAGERVSIMASGGSVMVGDANVTRADVAACNGVIHVIDAVLLPPDAAAGATTDTASTQDTAAGSATATTSGAASSEEASAGITVDQIPALPLSGATTGAGSSSATGTTATDTAASGTTGAAPATTAQAPAAPAQPPASDTVDLNAPLANSITKVIGRDPRLSTLAAALKAGNLEKAFDTAGDYTFFAPTNEAFAKIPQAQLDALLANPDALFEVLSYHVVPQRVAAAQVATLQNATTLQGSPLTVNASGATVRVNDATVVATDVAADNGVIHLIDTVLLPPNFELPAAATNGTQTAAPTAPATGTAAGSSSTGTAATAAQSQTIAQIVLSDARFSTLRTALQAAGLTDVLAGTGPFTVFAPTNDAFAKIPQDQLQALLANREQLTRVLQYHVTAGNLPAAQLSQNTSINTLAGANLSVSAQGGSVRVGDATVTQADVTASNGVIHVIDTVLMPPAQ